MADEREEGGAPRGEPGAAVRPETPRYGLSYDASEERARGIIRRIRARGGVAIDDGIQERLARLIGLLDDLRGPGDRALLFDQAELALRQLDDEPANLILFDRLLDDLRERVGSPAHARRRRLLLSVSPHIVVAGGAMVAMAISFFVTYGLMPVLDRPDTATLQVVTEAGFIGALTSLMLRFHHLRGHGVIGPRDAFFEGLFRPFIGLFFAWMTYYLLDAGLLPIRPIEGVSSVHLYAGIAFVTGFSERLATSFVDVIEQAAKRTQRGD